jgi:hypothetical protein
MIPRAEKGLMMGWDNIYAANGNGRKQYLEGLLGGGGYPGLLSALFLFFTGAVRK